MSDFANLMKAIVTNPADDLPRLVAADWLDENGEPERAEFIRVQIELHRIRGDKRDYRKPLDRRERALSWSLPRTPYEYRIPSLPTTPPPSRRLTHVGVFASVQIRGAVVPAVVASLRRGTS